MFILSGRLITFVSCSIVSLISSTNPELIIYNTKYVKPCLKSVFFYYYVVKKCYSDYFANSVVFSTTFDILTG